MNKISKVYIGMTLLISWIFTFILYFKGILVENISFIMLVPMFVSIIIRIAFDGITKELYKRPNVKCLKYFFKAFLFATVVPIIIVASCALLGAVLYGQSIDNQFIIGLFNFRLLTYFLIMAMFSPVVIFSLGEEYGWRAFLLPELCKTHSKVEASTIVGVVWALYHFPVMILLNLESTGMIQSVGLALVQGTAAFAFSYIFSYCYFLSNRLYPTVIMHGFWNIYNPYVLGSIYLGNIGKVLYKGPIFMTNGEGIFGIIMASIVAIVLIFLMGRGKSK